MLAKYQPLRSSKRQIWAERLVVFLIDFMNGFILFSTVKESSTQLVLSYSEWIDITTTIPPIYLLQQYLHLQQANFWNNQLFL